MHGQQLDIFQPLPAAEPPAVDYLASIQQVIELLEHWQALNWLRALDKVFAQFIADLYPAADPLFILTAALVSHQQGRGHVCLQLDATLKRPDFVLSLPPEGDLRLIKPLLPSTVLMQVSLAEWQALIAKNLVQLQQPILVLQGTRLYTQRFWHYEQQLGKLLTQRMQLQASPAPELPRILAGLFAEPSQIDGVRVVDWQKIACALASQQSFTIITGGPGTGKTTTVVRLLALLQQLAVQRNSEQPLRIRLAAPTGKAAARLTESIGGQIEQLQVAEAIKKHIPQEVVTLHRLLGSKPDSRAFKHNADNPLLLDVLVIDEASMVDLEMMFNVLQALPTHAQLILLGDKNQLASVEAGAVLGDLCHYAEQGYAPELQAQLMALTGEDIAAENLAGSSQLLAQHTVMLRHSRRFAASSAIGQLAKAVNQQDARQALQTFSTAQGSELDHFVALDTSQLNRLLINSAATETQAIKGYAFYLQQLRATRPADDCEELEQWQTWSANTLTNFSQFQLLAAVRKGAYGVEQLNQQIADSLAKSGLIHHAYGWYEGRPVMVTQNDYSLGLMNGDVGIALYVPTFTQQGRVGKQLSLRVAFAKNDGTDGVRWLLPSRLSAIETVFAMTVHKSQGSEFNHTALVLPEQLSPVLTKELIYTAITRAKQHFTLIESNPGIFEKSLGRSIQRSSGLLEQITEISN